MREGEGSHVDRKTREEQQCTERGSLSSLLRMGGRWGTHATSPAAATCDWRGAHANTKIHKDGGGRKQNPCRHSMTTSPKAAAARPRPRREQSCSSAKYGWQGASVVAALLMAGLRIASDNHGRYARVTCVYVRGARGQVEAE